MAKQNSMLKTEDGKVRYYLYQKAYREKNIKYFRVRFSPKFDSEVIGVLNAMGLEERNEWLKKLITDKLKSEGKI